MKIGDLSNYSTPGNNDELAIVDVTNNITKKVTRTNLFKNPPLEAAAVTETMLYLPHFWPEIGRTTLGSAGDTITINSIPARRFLMVLFDLPSGGTTIVPRVRFNNDTGNNYSWRMETDGAADSTAVSQAFLGIASSTTGNVTGFLYITNVAALGKSVKFLATRWNGSAANAPGRDEGSGGWGNTTNQITRIDVINGGAGDFAIGSSVVVLGHD